MRIIILLNSSNIFNERLMVITLKCMYCGNELTSKEKLEHIIPNALSGMLTSRQIGCSTCNSILGQTTDLEFNKIFIPILKTTYNFYKTNNAQSWPGDNNNETINIDVPAFAQGMSKIALEYAALKNIKLDILKENYKVNRNATQVVETIEYVSPIIPFFPMNTFDRYLELDAQFYLSHKLILFSHENYLVCYVDLFSTFQCYVVISKCWNMGDIYEAYVQEVRLFKKANYGRFFDYKDLQIMLMEHKLWPNPEDKIINIIKNTKLEKTFNEKRSKQMNFFNILGEGEIFSDILERADRKYYYNEISLNDAIERQVSSSYQDTYLYKAHWGCNISELSQAMSILFYLDEDDRLNPSVFRKLSPQYIKNQTFICFYPMLISANVSNREVHEYQESKLQRLITFLESI